MECISSVQDRIQDKIAVPFQRSQRRRQRNILELPDEILLFLFLLLRGRLRDLSSLARTCRTFRRILTHPTLFRVSNRIQQAEDLSVVNLSHFISEEEHGEPDDRQALELVFSYRRSAFALAHWENSIARNLERSLPNLYTLHLRNCTIAASALSCYSLPKGITEIFLHSCTLIESYPLKSFVIGLPCVPRQDAVFQLLFAEWKFRAWKTIEMTKCKDQFGRPYGIILWNFLHHGLEGGAQSWQHVPNGGSEWKEQRRDINGVDTAVRHRAVGFRWLGRTRVSIRRHRHARIMNVTFSETKQLTERDLDYLFTATQIKFLSSLIGGYFKLILPVSLAGFFVLNWLAATGTAWGAACFWTLYLVGMLIFVMFIFCLWMYSLLHLEAGLEERFGAKFPFCMLSATILQFTKVTKVFCLVHLCLALCYLPYILLCT